MNSLRNDTKQKKNSNSILTTETFGVVLMLFSALSLVCVISYDKVFSVIGQYVCEFLVGTFGYMAIAVLATVFVMGFLMLVGKKIAISSKNKAIITLICFILCLLLNVISLQDFTEPNKQFLSFGEYLSQAYAMGVGGLSGATCGGLVLSVVSYWFPKLLTNIGSIIIISVGLALSVYLFAKNIYNDSKVDSTAISNFKSSYVSNDVKNVPNPDELEEREYPVANIDFSDQEKHSSQKLFVNNPNEFELKSKRDLRKEEDDNIKINYEKKGLAVGNSNNFNKQAREIEQKIQYIKTPATINIDKDFSINANRENNDVKISNPIKEYSNLEKKEVLKNATEDSFVGLEENSIPIREHDDTTKITTAIDHAVEFSDKYADIPDEDIVSGTIDTSTDSYKTNKSATNHYDFSSINGGQKQAQEEAEKIAYTENLQPKAEEHYSKFKENIEIENDKQDIEEVDPPISSIKATTTSVFGEPKEEPKAQVSNLNNENISSERVRSMGFGERQSSQNNSSNFASKSKFDIPQNTNKVEKKEEEKPKKVAPPINRKYNRPPLDLLERHNQVVNSEVENHEERMEIIKQTLEDFHINAEPQSYVQGPSVTRYEVKMPAGVSVKKVLTLDDDLRMRLASKNGIRIEAPIPGKNLVGVEVANRIKETVGLREILEQAAKKPAKPNALMFALGKNIVGDAITDNLAKGPHYLVAGATGSGKSVCLNVMIISMIMRYSPEELRLILVDPKSVGFRIYEHLPHLMIDEIITEPQKTLATLQWAYVEMERRYNVFKECDQLIMDIEAYNERIAGPTVAKMPRIVIVIDELADLMETCKKEMESKIRALAQKSRAAGIHLVLATQRPSVDIITGTIKANLPSRIALKVMNFADSNTILSEGGAEKLLGNGDMLYKNSSMAEYERYQGAWLSDLEITNVVNYIKENNKAYFDDELTEYLENALHPKQDETAVALDEGEDSIENDDVFRRSLALGISMGAISISMIQRRFSVGFSRAGRIVDAMEKLGYIGANEGNSKGRKVLITKADFENKYGEMPD